MKAYIHKCVTASTLDADFKTLVPDALMRRRMSRIVRDGVTAALVCSQGEKIDAILTATAFGCLGDSEKFLRNMISTGEEMLSPTAFIQSTFNTIGATVALLQKNRCYNMTYTHGRDSFLSALLDGVMLIEEGPYHEVLVGAVEEVTPTLSTLLTRLGVERIPQKGDACFFRLSGSEHGALARIVIEADTEADPETEVPTRRYEDPLSDPRELIRALEERQDVEIRRNSIKYRIECL